MRVPPPLAVALGLLAPGLGCSTSPYDTAGSAQERAAPTKAAPLEAKVGEKQAPEAKEEIPPLTEEDLRLLEADPATLTPEERRQRAYAMRRKIMQNPDSATARAIEEMAEAIRNGEVKPEVDGKKQYPTLYLPGKGPGDQPDARPPAGAKPKDAAEKKNGEAP